MNPGLAKRYKEKVPLRLAYCKDCKRAFPSTRKIARCGVCGVYIRK